MTKIDPNTIPDTIPFKAEDFVASDAVKCAPLGGINENSVDTTVVMNAPIGPDREYMVFIWMDPRKIPIYKQYGIKPVTVGDWKRLGLIGTSATIDLNDPSHVYRDSRSVCLGITTKTRYTEIMHAMSEAAARSMGAKTRRHQEELDRQDAYGMSRGIPHFTVDEFRDGDVGPEHQGFVEMPGRSKGPRISLSGPRREQSDENEATAS